MDAGMPMPVLVFLILTPSYGLLPTYSTVILYGTTHHSDSGLSFLTFEVVMFRVHRFCFIFFSLGSETGSVSLVSEKQTGDFLTSFCYILLSIFHLFFFQSIVSVSETNVKGQCHQIQVTLT
jgi:hypothetical protein